jgi:hypothetical protein
VRGVRDGVVPVLGPLAVLTVRAWLSPASPWMTATPCSPWPGDSGRLRRLLVWARKRGTVRRAGVAGTGTFGAGLSCYLLTRQIQVFEVNRPDRVARRQLGKSDSLDAQAAARAVLSLSRPGARASWC